MKRLFIDTNVVLDLLMGRKPFYRDSAGLLLLQKKGVCELLVSSLTMANIAYVLRKTCKGKSLYDVLDRLKVFLQVVGVDESVVDRAIALRSKDFEDALQYFSAVDAKCDYIITRNGKDFPKDKNLPILAPDEFLMRQYT